MQVHIRVYWLMHYLDDFLLIGAPDSNDCTYRKQGYYVLVMLGSWLPIRARDYQGRAITLAFWELKLELRDSVGSPTSCHVPLVVLVMDSRW